MTQNSEQLEAIRALLADLVARSDRLEEHLHRMDMQVKDGLIQVEVIAAMLDRRRSFPDSVRVLVEHPREKQLRGRTGHPVGDRVLPDKHAWTGFFQVLKWVGGLGIAIGGVATLLVFLRGGSL